MNNQNSYGNGLIVVSTIIGVIVLLLSIYATFAEYSNGQLFFYYGIALVFFYPLLRRLFDNASSKMVEETKSNAIETLYNKFDSSSGAQSIVRYCRNIKPGKSITVTATEVRIMDFFVEEKSFKISNPLNRYGKVNELKVFSMWLYNQINLPGYVIVPMQGNPSNVPTGIKSDISGSGYTFTYNSLGGDDVFGYEIRRSYSKPATQKVTL